MKVLLTLPRWMVERIVAILDRHPYTGAQEIIQKITEQMEENA